jgi:hypothetical protein
MRCWVSETSFAMLPVFLHCKLEHLDCPLEALCIGGTVVSAIQLHEAWTVLITLQVDVSDYE